MKVVLFDQKKKVVLCMRHFLKTTILFFVCCPFKLYQVLIRRNDSKTTIQNVYGSSVKMQILCYMAKL